MKNRPLNEIKRLNKVTEVSLCTQYNPPANGFRTFDIIKNSINKDMYSDLFEEMKMPEYGEFSSYLEQWLEEDVNRVAYGAFLDALFNSLQDVVYDSTLDKQGKLDKFKENFDSFITEYQNSVITKSENGDIKLDLNKKSTIKQEKKVDILEELKKLIAKASTKQEIVTEVVDEKVKKTEEVEEVVEEIIENQETVEQETPEVEAQEPVAETEEVVEESEEPTQEVEEPIVESEEVIEETEVETVEEDAEVLEPEVQAETEVVEELEKSEDKIEEIVKAKEDKIVELEKQLEDFKKTQADQTVKLEKAELSKEIEKSYLGLPKTRDEIVDTIYEINKASISEDSKSFILESLKSLSSLNKKDCQEVGHSEEVDVNKSSEEILSDKIKKTMQDHDILEEQALLVVTEGRSIAKAKEVTEMVRKRK